MIKTKRFSGKSMLRLGSSAALCLVLSMPFVMDFAAAQESQMRSTFDAASPLANSPLANSPLAKNTLEQAKKLRRKGIASAPLNPSPQYSTSTTSDAEADLLLQLGEDGALGPNSGVDGAMTKSANMSDVEADTNNENASLLQNTGQAANRRSSKQALLKNGKTTLEPALDPQTTGTLVVRKGQQAKMLRAQKIIPAEAVQSRDLTEEENPFDAVGIRLGSITLRPALEQGLEVTSNKTGSAGGGAATSSITTLRLNGQSDWRNGSLETTGFLTLRKALSGNNEIDPEAGASFTLTQPVLREWNATIGGVYGLKRESAVSGSAFPITITQRPLAQDIRLSLGVGKSEGTIQPSVNLEFGRLTYGNATDATGLQLSQSDRDQSSLRGTLRLGAELSPLLTPFIEVAYGKTWRDDEVDVFGNDRSSSELRTSIGTKINASEKLNGEISIGWLRQTFDDANLSAIEGIALAAALNWSPSQGTVVSAGLSTTTEAANAASVSGSVLYAGNMGITHQLSSRFSTAANFGLSYRDFTDAGGHDTTLSAELAATYWVNRMLGVNAKARYEVVSSSDVTRESDTTTFLLGLKIQR